jgi:replicative DNA helicase
MSARDQQPLRVPPQSAESEQAVLAAVLLDNEAWERVSDVLTGEDFYRYEHREIFGAIAALIAACRPADVITVFEQLKRQGVAEKVGGLGYINELAASVPSSKSARRYAEVVRECALRRRVIAVADALTSEAFSPGARSTDDVIDAACNELVSLMTRTTKAEPVPLHELLVPWIDDLTERAQGKTDAISTGLTDLDRVLAGGVRRGEVMVIGARPSMGKSAASLGLARRMAIEHTVLTLSLEDSRSMLVSRHVAAVGRVNLADLRRPEYAKDSMWSSASDALEQLRMLKLYVDDTASMTLADVRTKAQQVRRRAAGLDVVVLDYLQLMEGDGKTRAEELTAVARGVKRMAKEMNVAVILLSQLSREADKMAGPPRLDHLAESGGIEQAADIIGLLWREARSKPKPDNKHDAQIEIAKNKNGPTDTVRLWFDGATQRFEDYHGGVGDDQ